MNETMDFRRGAAVLACAFALLGAVLLTGAGAASADNSTSCGSKTISVKAGGGKSVQVAASRIQVEGGATCKTAYAVIRGVVTKNVPKGWTVHEGGFKVPRGLVAQEAKKGKMTVEFALVGR
jgi:hypothetical protein